MNYISSQGIIPPDSKKHYEILDGLRGVAAVIVVIFHIFEIFSGGDHTKQLINHGYLAVDFFFLLSGFVIAHAYDDRWNNMSLRDFFTRRLIRLHPMIIFGMIVGALCFYPSQAAMFPAVAQTPLWKMLLVTVFGFALIPVRGSLDIRGWGEMYPHNGPAWTLFFEYIANIFYALFLRRISNIFLGVLVVISAVALVHFAVTGPNGDVIGGWSLDAVQLQVGFTRLAYPFLAGLLLSRLFRPGKLNNAFLWCSLLLSAILFFPRVGGKEALWLNGIYDASVILFLFPLIVYMGASGQVRGRFAQRACRFLGNISYPIYIVHYPIIYVFYAWIDNNKIPIEQAWPMGIAVLVVSLSLSYVAMKWYDMPLRKWLISRVYRK